ncbi:hypothetical protein GMOD_00002766 [Pyrenophora seminiperda CCB06]|uniref:Uncharacterized protein n=1 Tax=Pyrenophora seminiperda CCB06 TaxID=1302712 RepID=A0A3M7M322_9PLEO|nr:hypothetical protein GMOD_00002766 [Pyrenophora seminiperda CCB06]
MPPLEVFDLILHLSSLAKVTKLMIISSPGFRGKKWLRRFRWFKDVLVALLSLFWPTKSSDIPLLVKGNVTVADLNFWYVDMTTPGAEIISEEMGNAAALEAAWTFGLAATAYPVYNSSNIQTDLSGLPGVPIYQGDDAYHYRFLNRDPAHQWTNYLTSSRNVTAKATCTQLDILNGTLQDIGDEPLYLEAREPGTEEYVHWPVPEGASGSVTWVASVDAHCGARCTNFTVMQLGIDGSRVNKTSLFVCNSTLTSVTTAYAADDITVRSANDTAAVYGTDNFARIAAGAIGWTGLYADGWDDRQAQSYSQGSIGSPAHNVEKHEIEDLLMRFTIGAVAAFDDHGIRYNLTSQTVVPTQGQQLDVDWSYIFSILGGICGIQFLALLLLVLFAHRTIVRDDSYFSMAMLLRPVVSRIGEGGMLMSGDEIKESKALKWKKIRYDYREGANGEPNRVAIFWEGRDQKEGRKSWAAGSYS